MPTEFAPSLRNFCTRKAPEETVFPKHGPSSSQWDCSSRSDSVTVFFFCFRFWMFSSILDSSCDFVFAHYVSSASIRIISTEHSGFLPKSRSWHVEIFLSLSIGQVFLSSSSPLIKNVTCLEIILLIFLSFNHFFVRTFFASIIRFISQFFWFRTVFWIVVERLSRYLASRPGSKYISQQDILAFRSTHASQSVSRTSRGNHTSGDLHRTSSTSP